MIKHAEIMGARLDEAEILRALSRRHLSDAETSEVLALVNKRAGDYPGITAIRIVREILAEIRKNKVGLIEKRALRC